MAFNWTLDRWLTLERASVSKNDFNEDVPSWEQLARVHAAKIETSYRDRERMEADELVASTSTRFIVRWSPRLGGQLAGVPRLNAKDRGVCEGRTYEIVDVRDLGRREGLEIFCVARAD